MSKANEPAFPTEPIAGLGGMRGSSGLTKREYFAGLAMRSIVSDFTLSVAESHSCAAAAVQFADALLSELDK